MLDEKDADVLCDDVLDANFHVSYSQDTGVLGESVLGGDVLGDNVVASNSQDVDVLGEKGAW